MEREGLEGRSREGEDIMILGERKLKSKSKFVREGGHLKRRR